ncbi:MAG: LamB/YcsF family protein [Ignavibacteriales bacterium]|nr:LamB/YcsF family protein [Ignavibacteriales bacterium]
MKEAGGDLILMGLPDSEMLKAAQEVGVRVAREAFGDRAYNEDGSLVSRKIAGSLITDPDQVAERVIGLAQGARDRDHREGDPVPGGHHLPARRHARSGHDRQTRPRAFGEGRGAGASAGRHVSALTLLYFDTHYGSTDGSWRRCFHAFTRAAALPRGG